MSIGLEAKELRVNQIVSCVSMTSHPAPPVISRLTGKLLLDRNHGGQLVFATRQNLRTVAARFALFRAVGNPVHQDILFNYHEPPANIHTRRKFSVKKVEKAGRLVRNFQRTRSRNISDSPCPL